MPERGKNGHYGPWGKTFRDCVNRVSSWSTNPEGFCNWAHQNYGPGGPPGSEDKSSGPAGLRKAQKAGGEGMDKMAWTRFIPIEKFDSSTGILQATMAEEAPDKVREILDYQKTVPEVLAWSESIRKASGGKSLGNVRVMHTPKVAGKVVELRCDDAAKKFPISIQVIDPLEKVNVEEGCYTGVSIGGDYKERYPDPQNPALTRYVPIIREVSLVDNPCMYGATFEHTKAAGGTEMRKFVGHRAFSINPEVMEKLETDGTLKKEERGPVVKVISGALEAANAAVAALRKLIAEYATVEGDPSTWTLDQMTSALGNAMASRGDLIGHVTHMQSLDMRSAKAAGAVKTLADLVKAARSKKGLGVVEAGLLLGKAIGAQTDDPKAFLTAAETIQAVEAGKGIQDPALVDGLTRALELDPAEVAEALKTAPLPSVPEKGLEPEDLRKFVEGLKGANEVLVSALEKGLGDKVEKVVSDQITKAKQEFQKSLSTLEERVQKAESALLPVGRPVGPAEKALGTDPADAGKNTEVARLSKALSALAEGGTISRAQELEVRRKLTEASIMGLGR